MLLVLLFTNNKNEYLHVKQVIMCFTVAPKQQEVDLVLVS